MKVPKTCRRNLWTARDRRPDSVVSFECRLSCQVVDVLVTRSYKSEVRSELAVVVSC